MPLIIDECKNRKQDHQSIDLKKDQSLTFVLLLGNKKNITKTVDINFQRSGATAQVIALFWGEKDQSNELNIHLNHYAPNTTGSVFAKGVVTDQATFLFNGLIKIDKKAQQTQSFLEEKTLILSKEAKAHAVPSLEIEANDVKASHAATLGKIDPEQLFYLQSRGLNISSAKTIMLEGFYQEALNKIDDQAVSQMIRKKIIKMIQRNVSN